MKTTFDFTDKELQETLNFVKVTVKLGALPPRPAGETRLPGPSFLIRCAAAQAC